MQEQPSMWSGLVSTVCLDLIRFCGLGVGVEGKVKRNKIRIVWTTDLEGRERQLKTTNKNRDNGRKLRKKGGQDKAHSGPTSFLSKFAQTLPPNYNAMQCNVSTICNPTLKKIAGESNRLGWTIQNKTIQPMKWRTQRFHHYSKAEPVEQRQSLGKKEWKKKLWRRTRTPLDGYHFDIKMPSKKRIDRIFCSGQVRTRLRADYIIFPVAMWNLFFLFFIPSFHFHFPIQLHFVKIKVGPWWD